MATLKNPSIYDDRSTIGSADELDEYGVWVKIEPEELSDTDADNFPDFEADFGPEISLDETSEDDAAFADFAAGAGEDSNFDDVEALRQDIESFPPAEPARNAGPADEAAPEPPASKDLSTQLLMKIADELSSIKDELSTLKKELSTIRAGKPAEDAGFFDEEDDDKIALTGDELDNIIHTADFTEETGFDAGASLADDFAPSDVSADTAAAETAVVDTAVVDTAVAEPAAAAPDAPAESTAPAEPSPPGDGGGIIYDGLGRPLQTASPEDDDPGLAAPAAAAETDFDSAGDEIIYDGLGRPLNRKISEDNGIGASLDISFGAQDSDDLETLRENGVDPMTPAPEDTSYLEEDPLAEESLDLSDAVIEEPDLSEGVKDAPLEEPSLDNLSLIDFDTIDDSGETPAAKDEETIEEKPFFEDITFDDLPDPTEPLDRENTTGIANLDEGETIDLSIFEDDFLLKNTDAFDESDDAPDAENVEDLSFEVLDEKADLPVQENAQDNVITEDSFESISFDDDGEIDEVTVDDNLEQLLPDDMKIELDFPSSENDGIVQEAEADDDKNFDLPGSADTADAGDPTVSIAAIPPAITMGLREALIYMDKLLESLPEEKINEFAQSEHYATYKKLFEELGIPS
jgi:hypothetical protein